MQFDFQVETTRFDWDFYGSEGSVGYPFSILTELYQKYGKELSTSRKTFFEIYQYIHVYPQVIVSLIYLIDC